MTVNDRYLLNGEPGNTSGEVGSGYSGGTNMSAEIFGRLGGVVVHSNNFV